MLKDSGNEEAPFYKTQWKPSCAQLSLIRWEWVCTLMWGFKWGRTLQNKEPPFSPLTCSLSLHFSIMAYLMQAWWQAVDTVVGLWALGNLSENGMSSPQTLCRSVPVYLYFSQLQCHFPHPPKNSATVSNAARVRNGYFRVPIITIINTGRACDLSSSVMLCAAWLVSWILWNWIPLSRK